MTPLQQAVQAVIEDHCDKSPYFDDAMSELRKALEAEQAQAVEPYGWMVQGLRQVERGEFAEANAKSDAKRIGGTCEAFPVFTHPAPPPASTGERAELIEQLRNGQTLIEDEIRAADMLQADADLRTQLARRTVERDALKVDHIEQQVAAPAGYVLVTEEAMLDIKNRVNTLATLSLKAERYSVGREIKQDIADMLAAGIAAQQVTVPFIKHPNPAHHTSDFATEHLRDVVEYAKGINAALELWIASAQSGVTTTPCPVVYTKTRAIEAHHGIGAKPSHTDWSAA